MQGVMCTAGTATEFAVTTGQDLIQIAGNASCIAAIHEIRIGQSTDAGDADAGMVRYRISRCTTLGTGGVAESEQVLIPSAYTVLNSILTDNSSAATGLTLLHTDTFNIQSGLLYLPAPEARIVVPAVATEGVVLAFTSTVAATFSCSIVWEEIGIT